MTPFITTEKVFVDRAVFTMAKAVKDAAAGDYFARQAVTAAPAALDLIAAVVPALYELEARQEMKRKEYETLYEGEELPASLANELKQRAGKIAAIRFAMAKAGCVDVAPVKEAA